LEIVQERELDTATPRVSAAEQRSVVTAPSSTNAEGGVIWTTLARPSLNPAAAVP
jgi:hypothetical protein